MKISIELLIRLFFTFLSRSFKKLPWIAGVAAFITGWIWPSLYPWLLAIAVAVSCYLVKRKTRGLIGPVQLPAHDAYLPGQEVQWWYWTGHLYTEEGRRFGFEVVFFAFDNYIFKDQLVQAAITDVQENSFNFDGYIRFYHPKRIKDRFELSSGRGNKVTAVGENGSDKLHAEIDKGKYILDIELESTKPVAMRYGGNAHPYSFGGFTYYYSRTHMETKGTLTIDGKEHKVTGTTWFDRQYGELQDANFKGWQWFSIDLEDDRQYMIFDFLGENADVEKAGGITDAEGKTRDLYPDDFQVKVLGHWTSPYNGVKYPSGWEVTVDGETLIVEPLVKNQELNGKDDEVWVGVYWEGACSVSGTTKGQAYVELNGFADPIEV